MFKHVNVNVVKKSRVEKSIENQSHEIFVISEPNTIPYPGAVMVHFQDAFIAEFAVMCPVRFEFLTSDTVSNSIFICSFIHIIKNSVFALRVGRRS